MSLLLRTLPPLTAWRRWAALLAWLAVCTASQAQGAPGGPSWAELSLTQKKILTPLAKDWPSMDAERRKKWLEIAARYPSLPPEQQARMQQRMHEWARMTPEQRGQARLNFQQAKELPASSRQAQWEAYKALPAEQKEALVRQAGAAATAPVAKPVAPTRPLRAAPLDAQAPKSNTVASGPATAPAPRVVAPTVVQTGPGASTRLVSAPTPKPPTHQAVGQPKIDVREATVDRTTLLPKRTTPTAAAAPATPPAPPPPAASAP